MDFDKMLYTFAYHFTDKGNSCFFHRKYVIGRIRMADMLSLSLVDGRIFFVSEMKFPYKKIFHPQKKCGEILSYYQYYMETRIITASTTAK